jgi:hypothetical protein
MKPFIRSRKPNRKDRQKLLKDHLKLPTGTIVSSPVKGRFLSLPLLGWVGVREKTEIPLVMLVVMLFRSLEDTTPRGTLQIELPVYPETELATLALLIQYGWDGRIWPEEEGWPEPKSSEEENLFALLEQAKTLVNTLVFPTGNEGALAVEVNVARARGPFLMEPLPDVKEADSEKREKLRTLCNNPSVFYRSSSLV